MSYDSIEESTAEGRPLYLYQFTDGPETWRFTSRAADWVSPAGAVAGSATSLTWAASPLAHSNVVQTGDVERGTLELTFPISDPFARRFLGPRGERADHADDLPRPRATARGDGGALEGPGAERRGRGADHRADLREPADRAQARRRAGEVPEAVPPCALRARLRAQHRGLLRGRPGLGRLRHHDHGADRGAGADGWYRGGVLRHAGALGFIVGHSGSDIVLARTMPGLAAVFAASAELAADIAADAGVTTIPLTAMPGLGDVPAGSFATIDSEVMAVTAISETEMTVLRAAYGSTLAAHTAGAAIGFAPRVEIARGCDLRRDTCAAKFANLANFGGFPDIPGRNPFGGTSIV